MRSPKKNSKTGRRNADKAGANSLDIATLDVSVVIVNYNAGAFLSDAVASVFAQSATPVECIVVDNASRDDSISTLRSRVPDPRLTILEQESNLGFAAGCNRGIAQARGELVLLMNPDCFLEDASLARLVAALAENEDAGAVGPLILNMDGTEQRGCRRDIPTPWQIFCVGIGLHRLMPNHPRFRSFNQQGAALPDEVVRVQSVSGACILIRHETIEQVGLLDERYFLHFEDLDWCLRAGESGHEILFVPDAVAHHVGGISSRKFPIRVEAHKHASLIRFVRGNFAQYYPSAFILFVALVVYARFLAVVAGLALRGPKRRDRGWPSLFADAGAPKPQRGPVTERESSDDDG
ncbi:MAG: glycosyltransferase family 2 protein [Alphaproteobacteria bacterium]